MRTDIITETKSMGLDAIDAIFGTGRDAVLTSETFDEGEGTTSISTKNSINNKLDNLIAEPGETKTPESKAEDKKPETVEVPKLSKESANKLDTLVTELATVSDEIPAEAETTEKTTGRPKTDKNALSSYLLQKIESNDFGLPDNITFDVKKQTLEQLLNSLPEKELHTILDSNWSAKEKEIREQTPAEFYEALPDEAKAVAEYASRGGNDWKAFYQAMGRVEEVRALDINKDDDHPIIARSYLQAIRFGDDDKISEQIEDWKESGKLAKKAAEFKPELDNMQKQQVDAYQRQAEQQKIQQQKLAEFYAENVYNTLKDNELGGIKLDKKFARELADNMTSTVPGPWSGRPVNYLGLGLEKAQYIEPNYKAVMMAAWILNDYDAAIAAIGQNKANEAVDKVTKLVKLNQGLGTSEPVSVPVIRGSIKRINTGASLKRAIA